MRGRLPVQMAMSMSARGAITTETTTAAAIIIDFTGIVSGTTASSSGTIISTPPVTSIGWCTRSTARNGSASTFAIDLTPSISPADAGLRDRAFDLTGSDHVCLCPCPSRTHQQDVSIWQVTTTPHTLRVKCEINAVEGAQTRRVLPGHVMPIFYSWDWLTFDKSLILLVAG